MLKVLFTGGGGAGSEALFRLLGERYSVHFADADRDAIDPSIPADHRHTLPWASDPEFISHSANLCKRMEIDLLVPGVDEELHLLASHADQFEKTRLMLPPADYIAKMLDKLSMARSLAGARLPVPGTRRLDDDWTGLHFPCIVKPRHGRGSRGISFVHTHQDAARLRDQLGDGASSYIVQELLVGQEYTVQMVADAEGTLHAIVPVKVNLKRGITLRAETFPEPAVIATCQAIHDAFPTPGCYNIQLILTPDGKALPFEINPRVSTTLCLVVAAGIDPISVFISAGKQETKDMLSFTAGVKLQRHWVNHFTH